MVHPILVTNVLVSAFLTWKALHHFELVEYDPVDLAVSEFQRLVYYSHLDGSVMAPPETLMTVVSPYGVFRSIKPLYSVLFLQHDLVKNNFVFLHL